MQKSPATPGLLGILAILTLLAPVGVPAAQPTADLSVSLVVSPPTGLGPGGNLTYTATVTNNGPSTATSVSFTATTPPGIIPISATPDGSCVFSFDGTTVNCSLGMIANGASRTIVMVVHPITIGTKTTSGQVTAAETDPDGTNNSASASGSITEVGISNVEVQLFDAPDPIRVGQFLFYLASTHNINDDSAQNVTVEITIPAGVTLLGAASERGACAATGRRIACPLGTINPGVTVWSIVQVVPMTTGFLWAHAGVSLTTPDPNVVNNSAAARTWVNP
jgi:uncharacterized repeat protein (TIGR01451 family)